MASDSHANFGRRASSFPDYSIDVSAVYFALKRNSKIRFSAVTSLTCPDFYLSASRRRMAFDLSRVPQRPVVATDARELVCARAPFGAASTAARVRMSVFPPGARGRRQSINAQRTRLSSCSLLAATNNLRADQQQPKECFSGGKETT